MLHVRREPMHEDVNGNKEKLEYAHELSEKTIDTRLAKLHLEVVTM